MIKKIKYKNVTWIDLESPTKEEVENITGAYGIHPIVTSELTVPSLRSKIDLYTNFIYLVLHFPLIRSSHKEDSPDNRETHEVDFVLGKDFLITTHYGQVTCLSEFAKLFEAGSLIERHAGNLHAGYLFFHIIRELYQSLDASLETINSRLKKAEKRVFSDEGEDTVHLLSDINRDLIDFRWSIKYHRQVLHSLEEGGKDFFDHHFSFYLRAISGEFEKIWNALEGHRETSNDLRSTNDSLLTIKTNRAIRTLTSLAFFTFTLSAMSGIIGMGATATPILGHPFDFWIILGIMAGVTLLIYASFKKKGWL